MLDEFHLVLHNICTAQSDTFGREQKMKDRDEFVINTCGKQMTVPGGHIGHTVDEPGLVSYTRGPHGMTTWLQHARYLGDNHTSYPDQGTISHMLLLLADHRNVTQRSQIWASFRLLTPNSAWA